MPPFAPRPAGRGAVILPTPQPQTPAARRELADTSGLITDMDLHAMATAGATITRRAETVTVHTPIGGGRQTDHYTALGDGTYRATSR
jgi:hypothetical protein